MRDTYIEVAVVLYSSSPQASLSAKDSSGFISWITQTVRAGGAGVCVCSVCAWP